jgi:hypothetical protein
MRRNRRHDKGKGGDRGRTIIIVIIIILFFLTARIAVFAFLAFLLQLFGFLILLFSRKFLRNDVTLSEKNEGKTGEKKERMEE